MKRALKEKTTKGKTGRMKGMIGAAPAKRALCALLAALMLVSLAACVPNMAAEPAGGGAATTAAKSEDKAAEPVTTTTAAATTTEKPANVTMQVWISTGVTSEEQKSMSQDEWQLTKMLKAFEAAHPGVTIELTIPADQQVAHQTFKAAVLAGDAPDVANLWTGMLLFSLRDVVLPLDDLIPKNDLDIITAWGPTKYEFDGPILAYPYGGNELGLLLINKKLLKECGYDLEAKPIKTMEDLDAACEAAKGAGKIPILSADDNCNGLFTFLFSSQWTNLSGTARISSNSRGETKYSEDEGFLRSMQVCADYFAKGYVNDDYVSAQGNDSRFYQEQGTMLVTGNWAIDTAINNLGEENIDFITAPFLDPDPPFKNTGTGGAGQCLVIPSICKNAELAVELCSFLNNRENTISLLKRIPKAPYRTDISAADMGWDKSPLYAKLVAEGVNCGYWIDNAQEPEVMHECFKQGALVTIGSVTPKEAAAKLDQKAAEIKSTQ